MVVQLHLFRNATNVETYEAGTTIFSEGQPGHVMYVIQEGQVEILVNGKSLEVVGPGGIVGEMALIDSEPRSASAVAKTACRVVPVDQNRFHFLVQQAPYFAQQVMKIMAERIRAMDTLMDE